MPKNKTFQIPIFTHGHDWPEAQNDSIHSPRGERAHLVRQLESGEIKKSNTHIYP